MGGRDGDEASLLRDANKALKRLFIPCLCTVKYFSTRGALRVGRVDKESERVSCLLMRFPLSVSCGTVESNRVRLYCNDEKGNSELNMCYIV